VSRRDAADWWLQGAGWPDGPPELDDPARLPDGWQPWQAGQPVGELLADEGRHGGWQPCRYCGEPGHIDEDCPYGRQAASLIEAAAGHAGPCRWADPACRGECGG
jgi:Zinc knuckle